MGFLFFIVYIGTYFLRPMDLLPALAPLRLAVAATVLALLAALPRLLMRRVSLSLWPQIPLLLLFGSWAALSAVAAYRWYGAVISVLSTLGPSVLPALVVALHVSDLRRARWFAGTFVVVATLLSIQAIAAIQLGWRRDRLVLYQDPGGEAADGQGDSKETLPAGPDLSLGGLQPSTRSIPGRLARARAFGTLNDPNDFAQFLVASLPFSGVFWRKRRTLSNLMAVGVPVALAIYAIFLTRSRGGTLALAALAFLSFRRALGPTLSAILATVGGFGLLALGVAGGRGAYDESAADRLVAWSEGLQFLRFSPLWGVGFGTFSERYGLVAHNSFVHCFAELGLIGYGVWLALLVLAVRDYRLVEAGGARPPSGAENEAAHELSRLARAARLSLLSFLVGALFLSRTYAPTLYFLLGLSAALRGAARQEGLALEPRQPVVMLAVVLLLALGSVGMTYVVVQLRH